MTNELTLLVLHVRIWLDLRVALYLRRRAAKLKARDSVTARDDVRLLDGGTVPLSSGAPRRTVLVLI
ncbi:hypothetical protein [Bradyrhizobium aeschynomenes]|uniref:hypothetical protein n=1 Tax=Bradyrhizobium aeschynomenes TaxID=2734909 RepID=UPI001552B00E|nr:hypothetical protein [Bradyrhizobium aeschynomenes]NPV24728.1 hypothetical protein [Bradyrhizobium aeschynomenes]